MPKAQAKQFLIILKLKKDEIKKNEPGQYSGKVEPG